MKILTSNKLKTKKYKNKKSKKNEHVYVVPFFVADQTIILNKTEHDKDSYLTPLYSKVINYDSKTKIEKTIHAVLETKLGIYANNPSELELNISEPIFIHPKADDVVYISIVFLYESSYQHMKTTYSNNNNLIRISYDKIFSINTKDFITSYALNYLSKITTY